MSKILPICAVAVTSAYTLSWSRKNNQEERSLAAKWLAFPQDEHRLSDRVIRNHHRQLEQRVAPNPYHVWRNAQSKDLIIKLISAIAATTNYYSLANFPHSSTRFKKLQWLALSSFWCTVIVKIAHIITDTLCRQSQHRYRLLQLLHITERITRIGEAFNWGCTAITAATWGLFHSPKLLHLALGGTQSLVALAQVSKALHNAPTAASQEYLWEELDTIADMSRQYARNQLSFQDPSWASLQQRLTRALAPHRVTLTLQDFTFPHISYQRQTQNLPSPTQEGGLARWTDLVNRLDREFPPNSPWIKYISSHILAKSHEQAQDALNKTKTLIENSCQAHTKIISGFCEQIKIIQAQLQSDQVSSSLKEIYISNIHAILKESLPKLLLSSKAPNKALANDNIRQWFLLVHHLQQLTSIKEGLSQKLQRQMQNLRQEVLPTIKTSINELIASTKGMSKEWSALSNIQLKEQSWLLLIQLTALKQKPSSPEVEKLFTALTLEWQKLCQFLVAHPDHGQALSNACNALSPITLRQEFNEGESLILQAVQNYLLNPLVKEPQNLQIAMQRGALLNRTLKLSSATCFGVRMSESTKVKANKLTILAQALNQLNENSTKTFWQLDKHALDGLSPEEIKEWGLGELQRHLAEGPTENTAPEPFPPVEQRLCYQLSQEEMTTMNALSIDAGVKYLQDLPRPHSKAIASVSDARSCLQAITRLHLSLEHISQKHRNLYKGDLEFAGNCSITQMHEDFLNECVRFTKDWANCKSKTLEIYETGEFSRLIQGIRALLACGETPSHMNQHFVDIQKCFVEGILKRLVHNVQTGQGGLSHEAVYIRANCPLARMLGIDLQHMPLHTREQIRYITRVIALRQNCAAVRATRRQQQASGLTVRPWQLPLMDDLRWIRADPAIKGNWYLRPEQASEEELANIHQWACKHSPTLHQIAADYSAD